MAKKLAKQIKVQAVGGKATPAPPLGPVLGQAGINIGEFVNQFNERTRERMGEIVPIIINVYDDRSFDWKSLGRPVDDLILEKVGIKKGSGKPHSEKVGKITRAQLEEIYEEKKDTLNAIDVDGGVKVIAGTARSMGVEVEG